MIALVLLEVAGLTLAGCFNMLEGTSIWLSQEFTVYAKQTLTLSCQTRDIPSSFVLWYKTKRSNDQDHYLSKGTSYTITKATEDDAGIYVCSGDEYGFYDIRKYMMVNVVVPGDPSCAQGWRRHKNACYMYSPMHFNEVWSEANKYCKGSHAQLAQLPDNSDDLRFLSTLVKHRNQSRFWIAPPLDTREGYQKSSCLLFDNKKLGSTTTGDCASQLPFICQRVLPSVPKDVIIEHTTSSSVQVGWSVPTLSSTEKPLVYNVELTTSYGSVISRRSTQQRSLVFSNLQSNTHYRIRVQAENSAGNGSSSHFTSLKTKDSPPVIVSSPPNGTVKAGRSITLKCNHQDIDWYKEGSAESLGNKPNLTIRNASVKDEGTYQCAVKNGPKTSQKVIVIEPPVITGITGFVINQPQKKELKERRNGDVFLLCETSNRHPLKYAWKKDGTPLTSQEDTLKISLKDDSVTGEYECQVSNSVGTARKSLVVSPLLNPADEEVVSLRRKNSTLAHFIVITVLSILLAVCCFLGVAFKSRIMCFRSKNTRKLTTHSSSSETTAIELAGPSREDDSPRLLQSSPSDVSQDHDDVFPYEVARARIESRGPYMSLYSVATQQTQANKPDYLNISPSNRNDSAANCMYAPLKYTQEANDKKIRPYANLDVAGANAGK